MTHLWTQDAFDCLCIRLSFSHWLSLLFPLVLTVPSILSSLTVREYCPHGFEGLGFSIRQQVDGNPPFKVDEDRSIAPPSAKAKIVYTQHTRRGHLALLLRANQSQARVRTGL